MGASAKKYEPNVQRDMAKELAAAGALKHQLKEVLGDDGLDAITLKDSIEGQTGLLELMEAVVAQIGEDAAIAAGIDRYITTLKARASRLENRAELMRTMLRNGLEMMDQPSERYQVEAIAAAITARAIAALSNGRLDASTATVSVKAVAPKLVVVSEAEVPSQYWKEQDPVLDRKALTDALKQRDDVLDQITAAEKAAEKTGQRIDPTTKARLDALLAACPPIPGAELGNGSATVQIRFS